MEWTRPWACRRTRTTGADNYTDQEPDWVYWINRDESQIMAGRCWAELRQHTRAVPVLEHATAPCDETHAREVALYHC
ncbi:hypothetical protein [Streptomyces triculaminicus]|uniref:hypothetical protein n=1 Tax=Streptomyces triculaminicus TaxID=2816232 RepID=UPI00379AC61B